MTATNEITASLPPRVALAAANDREVIVTASPVSSEIYVDPLWAALATAGFGAAAGRSPHALQNIGEGGLGGLQFYQKQREEEPILNLRGAQAQQAQIQADLTKTRIGLLGQLGAPSTPPAATSSGGMSDDFGTLSTNIDQIKKADKASAQPSDTPKNNPGNIRPVGATTGFMSYPDQQTGVHAISDNLLAYQDQHGINTLSGIVSRWAPPSENPTSALIQNASKITGFAPDQQLDLHDPATRAKVIEATIRNEHGGQLPVDRGLINTAAASSPSGAGQNLVDLQTGQPPPAGLPRRLVDPTTAISQVTQADILGLPTRAHLIEHYAEQGALYTGADGRMYVDQDVLRKQHQAEALGTGTGQNIARAQGIPIVAAEAGAQAKATKGEGPQEYLAGTTTAVAPLKDVVAHTAPGMQPPVTGAPATAGGKYDPDPQSLAGPPSGVAATKLSKADEDRLAQDTATYGEYKKAAESVPQTVQRTQELTGILKTLNTGKILEAGKDFYSWARAAGFEGLIPKGYDPSDAEMVNKLATSLVFQQVKEVGGRPMVTEITGLQQSNPSIALTPRANLDIVGNIEAGSKYIQDRFSQASNVYSKYHQLGNFDQKYLDQSPLGSIFDATKRAIGAGQTPASQILAHFPDARRAPDGNWYIERGGKYSRLEVPQ